MSGDNLRIFKVILRIFARNFRATLFPVVSSEGLEAKSGSIFRIRIYNSQLYINYRSIANDPIYALPFVRSPQKMFKL